MPKPKRRVTWFVLADGSRARFLTRRQEESGFEVAEEHDAPEARVPTREIGSDRPGRVHESANSAHHGVEAHHDAHRDRKTAFARQLADRLNAASAAGIFDALVLYAAPRSLATLREALDEATRRKITGEFPKDLTKVPLAELPHHLDEVA
jgi:protein required for attachment to host cells